MTLQEEIFSRLCGWSFQNHLDHLDTKGLTQHEILHQWKPPIDLLAAKALILAHAFRDRQRDFHEATEARERRRFHQEENP